MLRGLPPEEARANLAAILAKARGRGLPVLLVGMTAPANYGPDYKAAFDAIYPDLAVAEGALLLPDFFDGFRAAGADLTEPESFAAWMQADGIHPNAEGVALIVAVLGPKVLELLARAGG
jgi:acyl-CoA thioesterase-1